MINPNENPIKMENIDSTIQEIKKEFFRYRNGVLADSIKKLLPDGTLIFGLMLPDLMQISKRYSKDLGLGLKLWEDKKNRESRLLSLFILPPEEIERETAKNMFIDIRSIEEAELLPFKILRHLPYAMNLYQELVQESFTDPNIIHALDMFKKNLQILK